MYDVELLNMDENSATISSISSESTVFPQLFTYNPLMYSRISFFIASKHFDIDFEQKIEWGKINF